VSDFKGPPLWGRDRALGGSLVLPLRHKLSRSRSRPREREHDLAQEHHVLQPEVCNRAPDCTDYSPCPTGFPCTTGSVFGFISRYVDASPAGFSSGVPYSRPQVPYGG